MNKAILHVDGDSFFVGCELAHRPDLRGKPVISGREKGIACAMSYEAKKLGIHRAMPVFKAKKLCPDLVVLPENFPLYRLYSRRMVAILRRFTPHVEAYSIDECFADLTGCDRMLGMTYEEIGRAIKKALQEELGMTFSVGVSVNKVLAKTASKWQKPDGFKMIGSDEIEKHLSEVPIGKIWGIGRATAAYCIGQGIHTAGDLYRKNEPYIAAHFDKPLHELWLEMRGISIFDIHDSPKEAQKSFMSTSTFRPPTNDRSYLLRELSRHVEEACRHMRTFNLCAKQMWFYLKRQEDMRYSSTELFFEYPTSSPEIIVSNIEKVIDKIFLPKILYRATGVSLFNVIPEEYAQHDLFGSQTRNRRFDRLENYVDVSIRSRYGNDSVMLGSSVRKQIENKRSTFRDPHNRIFILRKVL